MEEFSEGRDIAKHWIFLFVSEIKSSAEMLVQVKLSTEINE